MRIALISDIHANLVALDAVLSDINRHAVDQIICLGDVATLGPQPHEVIARLQSLGCPCITGNHEDDVLDVAATQREMRHPQIVIDSIAWCAAQLSADEVAYLKSFVPLIEIELDDQQRLLCFHGSPRSHRDIILAETPSDELDVMLKGYTAMVMAGGHTHIQMLRRHNTALIVNVGSVGGPMLPLTTPGPPQILPWAEYAIVVWQNGRLGVEMRQTAIDFDLLKEITAQSDNPLRWTDFWVDP